MVFGNNDPFDEQPTNDSFWDDSEDEEPVDNFEQPADELARIDEEVKEAFSFGLNRISESESREETCDHDEKEVETIDVGGGATVFGVGAQGNTSILVTACPKCNEAWKMKVNGTGNRGPLGGR